MKQNSFKFNLARIELVPAILLLISCFPLFSADIKKPSPNLTAILQKNLFFSPLETKKDTQQLPVFITSIKEPEPLDKTYSLSGTFVFTDEPEKNTAVLIENSSKKIIFLKNGDIINGNRVISIEDNGVLFQSGFGEKFLLTQSGIKALVPQPKRFYFRVNLKSAIQYLTMKPDVVYSIKFSHVDSPSGFKVQEIEPQSIFESAGLGLNDVITQINDKVLQSPDDAMSAYIDILKSGKKIALVKAIREKKLVELVYFLE